MLQLVILMFQRVTQTPNYNVGVLNYDTLNKKNCESNVQQSYDGTETISLELYSSKVGH